ncbi:MAG: glutamine hydrolyzing CTP synthase [Halobacteriota archaeon]
MRYIVVTGGVMSGLGKGITAASAGRLLINRGYNVTAIKIDPYINIDAGTMSPFQHGEVFVLKDGAEVDLDLGNYERFLDVELIGDHNITTGKIYKSVIERERRGDYLGKTVQIIPHITDEIKSSISSVAEEAKADVCVVEVGGTVGDIESMPFLEAIRQMHSEEEHLVLLHVTLVPEDMAGDHKTKPTQHSVKSLRELGLSPDVIVGRGKTPLTKDARSKISLFCDVPLNAVISAYDVPDIYQVPSLLELEGLGDYLVEKLALEFRPASPWDVMKTPPISRSIAIVGKYMFEDAYFSIKEAIKHAASYLGGGIDVKLIDAEDPHALASLESVHGILVAHGFGPRGSQGKIEAIRFARENDVPFLGICFGFQLAIVEFCRNVLGLEATSAELDPTGVHVVDVLPEQLDVDHMGGTMRLGNYDVAISPGTRAASIYNSDLVTERHRHRFEVNPDYIARIEEHGMVFSGRARDGIRMEIAEIPSKRFFIGTQFHPEFKSRPGKPSPPFLEFVRSVLHTNMT